MFKAKGQAMTKLQLKSKQERKKRVPLGAQRIKGVVANQDKAFHYHWINDVPGRIGRALEGGYQLVPKEGVNVGTTGDANTNLGSMVSQYAGRDESGQAYNRYLMRIRNEWYTEDQMQKQSDVDGVDRAIRTGKFKRGANPETSYVPKDGIRIT
jgi:hypothetical protein